MFIIFGWNYQVNSPYGPVEQHQCPNCLHTEPWQLIRVSRYVTLFFIPILRHHREYWICCPNCNFGTKLDKDEFRNYKSIIEINSAFLEKKISAEDRTKQLSEIQKNIEILNEANKAKVIEESKKWVKLAAEKTMSELLIITNEKRNEYNPAFVIAAESEIESRNSTKAP
jgi:hypothetical protein